MSLALSLAFIQSEATYELVYLSSPENCKRAMELAQRSFNIPSVLEPEYLASPHLDELSGMTYLSYFMKEEDSPGYYATLDWVKSQIPTQRINNFRVKCQTAHFIPFQVIHSHVLSLILD